MDFTERNLVETYSGLFSGLSSESKLELIENLTKSIRKADKLKADKFFKSFGAFASDKSPDEIVQDIKSARKFKSKEIRL